jgi:predicted nucleotide-binding protein
VVILTDDGRATGDEGTRPRASRNYGFELGFFLGRVGRDRICALQGPGVEIPSDVSGVLSVEFDPRGSWQLELARDLRKAGFAVDLNRLLECPGGDPPHARR